MASKGVHFVWLAILLNININAGQLIEGKIKPASYVSFPPNTFDENPYTVPHTLSNCTSRDEVVDSRTENVVICPYGELLLDDVIVANLEDNVVDEDIQHFYTWEESSIPIKNAFITLQFPGEPITPTRVVVHCLELRDLNVREPKGIKLYSSTTESIFPGNEIQNVDDNVNNITKNGIIADNDEYNYIRFDLIIPEAEKIPLNYLRISLDFEGTNWMFISEVEVYHMIELLTTTVQPITSSARSITSSTLSVFSSTIPLVPSISSFSAPVSMTTLATTSPPTSVVTSMATSVSVATTHSITTSNTPMTTSISTATTDVITTSNALSSSAPASTLFATISTLSVMAASTPTAFLPPNFVFPTVNPFLLHLIKTPIDVMINCTVAWEGDVTQLTTTWSYNEINISTSDKYIVTDSHLTIREFTPQDAGLYRCTVHHQSGWSNSRKYFISTNQGTAQESDDSSNGPPILIIAAAGGGGLALLVCIILVCCCCCCCIVCLRQKEKVKETDSFDMNMLQSHNISEHRKQSIDNIYAQIHPLQNEKRGNSIVLQRKSTIVELPIPQLSTTTTDNEETYGFLDDYVIMNKAICPPLSSTNDDETLFDIYDHTCHFKTPQSREDIYSEVIENPAVNDEETNEFSMCFPIYDDPRPLAENEVPRMIEWCNISVLTSIGEGQFGDVFVAETIGIDAVELGCKDTKATRVLVAIKTLKGNYSANLKQQFEKEIKFMARLSNANVIKLLGICNKGMPFIMMEYMKNGNLIQFLRRYYHPKIGKDSVTAELEVDIPFLLYIALQIANGMRYLASLGFIHRDLAARNCLVGEDYIIKVADFGMTQNLYNSSYFVMEGSAIVPIRWMAPESFFGKFSTKTDVWSYGITLWEIFTLCRQQPYEEMSDEVLLQDVQKEHKRTLLKRPPIAPDEVYSIMTQCWAYDPSQRSDFDAMYNQLFTFYMYIQ